MARTDSDKYSGTIPSTLRNEKRNRRNASDDRAYPDACPTLLGGLEVNPRLAAKNDFCPGSPVSIRRVHAAPLQHYKIVVAPVLLSISLVAWGPGPSEQTGMNEIHLLPWNVWFPRGLLEMC